jgi:phthalate 4,5-dioxygenase oxygenase subunit
MLRREDNERITRVGPGTPGGELMRRYWQPALLSEELVENDGAPVRVRLLGEDLVAFRDTMGRIGLIDAYCPHRRASMFFGRNEECGLRCVYHGWKFDVEGNCVEIPSEPPESDFKRKVKMTSYPTHESGGIIWAFMGPADAMDCPPDFEWLRAPVTHRHITKTYEDCNYLQGLEGGLDPVHSSFLHSVFTDKNRIRNREKRPVIEVEATDYGFHTYSSLRVDEERHYVRKDHYVLPFHQIRAGTRSYSGAPHPVPKNDGHIWVPIDDEKTWVFNWAISVDENAPLTPEYMYRFDKKDGRTKDDFIPGTYYLKQNRANDYLIDREVQKTQTFTGIPGVNTQDYAIQEGMGLIVDRSKEHLGTTDRSIIMIRKLLLEAVAAVERGERPRGAAAKTYRNVRAFDDVIPADQHPRDGLAEKVVAYW